MVRKYSGADVDFIPVGQRYRLGGPDAIQIGAIGRVLVAKQMPLVLQIYYGVVFRYIAVGEDDGIMRATAQGNGRAQGIMVAGLHIGLRRALHYQRRRMLTFSA